MTASSVKFHGRSNSLPSQPHPLMERFDQELHSLRKLADLQAMSSAAVRAGVAGLVELHTCVDNLLKLPQAQATLLQNKHGRRVAEELDGSVRLLDVCSSTRDALCSMKDQIQELRSASRTRKVEDSVFQERAAAYISSRKEAKKEMHALLKMLKLMEERCEQHLYGPPQHSDEALSAVVSAMVEARRVTIAIYRSMLSHFFKPHRASHWSVVVSKALKRRSGRVACEEDRWSNEIRRVDAMLCALGKKESSKEADMEDLKNRLQGSEAVTGSLEMGLELLYRWLIRNRVSFLNILNL